MILNLKANEQNTNLSSQPKIPNMQTSQPYIHTESSEVILKNKPLSKQASDPSIQNVNRSKKEITEQSLQYSEKRAIKIRDSNTFMNDLDERRLDKMRRT